MDLGFGLHVYIVFFICMYTSAIMHYIHMYIIYDCIWIMFLYVTYCY